jgi:hypothetical protein
MNQKAPTTNYGNNSALKLGAVLAGGAKDELHRIILNFDLSGLMSADVQSAILRRHYIAGGGPAFGARLYRCTRPGTWTEMGVTWNTYDGATAWTTAGGGGDYDVATPSPVAFTEPGAPYSGGHFFISGLGEMVIDAIVVAVWT